MAARLQPALEGRRLLQFVGTHVRRPHPRTGETIERVEAKGKHLLITFSGGLVLQTHMGMTGSWRLYEDARSWRRDEHLARCVIVVDRCQAVCFSAPTVRFVMPGSTPMEAAAGHLGPDLCRPDAD